MRNPYHYHRHRTSKDRDHGVHHHSCQRLLGAEDRSAGKTCSRISSEKHWRLVFRLFLHVTRQVNILYSTKRMNCSVRITVALLYAAPVTRILLDNRRTGRDSIIVQFHNQGCITIKAISFKI